MSTLAKATSGIIQGPKINLIYGPNKVGKTSFVCGFKKHVLCDIEKGSNSIPGANRVQGIDSLDTFLGLLKEMLSANHNYSVFGVDSVEALEGLIFDSVCKESGAKSIEDVGGGFGKGFMRSREIMREIMKTLRQMCDDKGIEIFLIGHSQTKPFTDPMTSTSYDKYTLRTNDKMASIIRDLSDNILFVSRKIMSVKKDSKEIVVSDNASYIYTQWRCGFEAGNRINLPFEIPLDPQAYLAAKEAGRPVTIDELKNETKEMIAGLSKEDQIKATERLKAAKTVEEVILIKQRVETLVTAA